MDLLDRARKFHIQAHPSPSGTTYDRHSPPICVPLIFLRKPKPHSPQRITNGDSNSLAAFADSTGYCRGGDGGVVRIRSVGLVVDMIDFENCGRSH